MNLDQYPFIKMPENYFYEFFSEGPKGRIKKVVQYHRIAGHEGMVFNLAFGDWNESNRRIDDKIRSNNNDREKVLATVAGTVAHFTKEHPNAILFAEGSTPARTRLYQIGIGKIRDQIEQQFEIYGLVNGKWKIFEKGEHYTCFLVKRR